MAKSISLLLILSLAPVLRAEEPLKYRPLPWHYLDLSIDFGKEASGKSISVDFQVMDDIAAKGNTFICPFSAVINGVRMYVGFGVLTHTRLDNGDGNKGKEVSAMTGVFSRWGTKDIRLSRDPEYGYVLASDHEDSHLSTRTFVDIKNGDVLKLQLSVASVVTDDKSQKQCWVKCSVKNVTSFGQFDLGSLQFPGDTLAIRENSAGAFLERFCPGGDKQFHDEQTRLAVKNPFPPTRFVIGNWMMDERPLSPTAMSALYPESVPQIGRALLVKDSKGQASDGLVGLHKDFKQYKSSVLLMTAKKEWSRPADLKKHTRVLDAANADIATVIRGRGPMTYLEEVLPLSIDRSGQRTD